VFIAGLALFGASSLGAGLATSPGVLIAMRAIQGFGGAMLSPAALALLTVTFAHGRERNIAMGIWGGLAGLGGTLGVVAGGVLVDSLSWRWVFFVNVPIVLAVVAVAPYFIQESRVSAGQSRSFDVPGAVLGTGGLLALVFGVVRAEPLGWSSPEVVVLLVAAAALLAAFVLVELRSDAPLVPARLFASRALRTSSVTLGLNGAAFLAMFFLTALYLQQVRGDSALQAGIQFLPMGGAAILSAGVASALVTRIGTRPVQLAGAVFSVAGLGLLTRAGAHESYATYLLPGMMLFGIGIIAIATAGQISAVADVTHADAGAASGVVSAVYQVGGAVGLAVITTLSTSRVTSALAAGHSQTSALVDGYHRGLLVAAVLAVVIVLASFASPQITPDRELLAEAVAA
jgi:EmrB/QacA subfamily drug resistance transporter